LGDVAEFHNSKRIPLSKLERSKRQGKYPYYGASGVIDHVDDYLFDGEYVLISEDGENLKTRKTPICFKASGKFWVNNHAHILKGFLPHHNNWIVYLFANLDLNQDITGAVQPKLSKSSLESITFQIPPIAEQKAIGEVLSSLDDKIDLLHSQNKTLESLAETLFRHHFIENAQDDWEEKQLDDIKELQSQANSGVQVNLTTQYIKDSEFLIPPIEKQKEVLHMFEEIFCKLDANTKQIQTLEKLRDTLLPKLISGDVRVQYEEVA
jgi:type I restriction enzyme S subunit